ncbi:MAG: hypothetical protein WCY49_06940 [Anaerovoracaceae bacterium]
MGTVSWPSTDETLTTPAELSGAGELVISKFNEARSYAELLWGTAINAMDDLRNMTFTFADTDISWTAVPLMGLDGITITEPDRPDITPLVIAWPEFVATEPTAYDVDIPPVSIPGFTAESPGVSFPAPPSDPWPVLTTDAPQLSEIDVPTKPGAELPPVPILNFANIPAPPEYSNIQFDAEAPVAELEPPSHSFVWNEAEYNSDVYEYLREKIYNQLISGGSGLADNVEQAIYDRATARQELENQRMYDEALNYFASRGSPLPPGALSGALIEIQYKIQQQRTDINNDILAMQAKLAQENTHFIINSALQLEKLGMDYSNALQTRAFEAAQYTIESSIKLFALKIETYKAKIEIYRTLAEVYEARILAEIAKAELYKSQIEAVRAHTDIQMAYIQLYMAQLQGINTLYQAYKTEMEGAAIKASIDRTKIESYMALVGAYTARINAITSKYQAYQAQVAGELGKVEVYKSQTQAYATQVQAIATGAQVDISRAQIALSKTQAETEVYKAKLQKYTADVGAKAAEIDSLTKLRQVDSDVYKADISAYSTELETLTRVYAGRVEEVKARIQSEIAQLDTTVRALLGKYNLMVEATKGIAQVASQLGASAFAGVSASAHIGHGESRSDATQSTLSRSYSYIEQQSVSWQNIYNHEV